MKLSTTSTQALVALNTALEYAISKFEKASEISGLKLQPLGKGKLNTRKKFQVVVKVLGGSVYTGSFEKCIDYIVAAAIKKGADLFPAKLVDFSKPAVKPKKRK